MTITINRERQVETLPPLANGGNGALPATVQDAALTPMEMLGRAVAEGAGIEVLTKLMDLQDRWEKNHARKAFGAAMALAKAEIPTIVKNRHVGFDSKTGGARTDYRHEDLGEIDKIVTPILAKHGLWWRSRTSNAPNEPITVTVIIEHRDGHYEENTLRGPPDNSGNKNSIQAIGSTQTYLQRYALKAALGLAASNDDDGHAAGNGTAVSDEQAATLTRLVTEARCNIDLFLTLAGVPGKSISDIAAAKYDAAVAWLNQKKQAGRKP